VHGLGFLGFPRAFFEVWVFVFSEFLGSFRRKKFWGPWIIGTSGVVEAELMGRGVITVLKYHNCGKLLR
jgi:hypothetical protein